MSNVPDHLRSMDEDFRSLQDNRGIEMNDAKLLFPEKSADPLQEQKAGNVLVTPVSIGKVLADVSHCRGAQEGIGQSMQQDVSVGMSLKPQGIRYLDTAEYEFAAGREGVHVVANTNAWNDDHCLNGFQMSGGATCILATQ
jgi:hypothetical protein